MFEAGEIQNHPQESTSELHESTLLYMYGSYQKSPLAKGEEEESPATA